MSDAAVLEGLDERRSIEHRRTYFPAHGPRPVGNSLTAWSFPVSVMARRAAGLQLVGRLDGRLPILLAGGSVENLHIVRIGLGEFLPARLVPLGGIKLGE